MIVTTTENVAGHRTVEAFGQVFGVVVRSRSIGGNLRANAANIARSAQSRCGLGLTLRSTATS